MKSKYLLKKQDDAIIIEERGELDPGFFSALCDKRIDIEDIEEAKKFGTSSVIELFRDINMFPPFVYSVKIAEAIIEMSVDGAETEKELIFSDVDFLVKGEKPVIPTADVDTESTEMDMIDEMLGEDIEEPFIEEEFPSLDDPESGSLKLADDDIGDMDIDV